MINRAAALFVLYSVIGLASSLWVAPTAMAQRGLATSGRTALDDYVAAPDRAFAWEVVQRKVEPGLTTIVVSLTSQQWRNSAEVDRTTWQHSLVVVKPDKVVSDKALIFIAGGRNGTPAPQSADEGIRQVALATGSIVAELGMIPNQPLVFHGDKRERYEDDLIGYAWDQFLQEGDPQWLPRLPMVKAVVRAMDTVQALFADDSHSVQKFVVAGGSKRGWTTWMTAAADQRVCAIVPIVIDVLNVTRSMNHHHAAYGFWAPAIDDYVHHKITDRLNSPEFARLRQVVDPFAYRARFTMPKCIINATGDEFFLPDSSRFYFTELPGEKHLCYVPNSNHSLAGTNALDTLIAFHHAIVTGTTRPEFTWNFPSLDTIRVTTKTEPERVLLWQATNPTTRDFRIDTIGHAYRSVELDAGDENVYTARVMEPEHGWTAFFVQLEFDVGAATKLRLSTPVRVIPDTLPFAVEADGAPESGR